MKAELQATLLSALENVISFKFLALLLASVFFAIGKLSDTLWVEVVFVVCGLRAATDISQIMKPVAASKVVPIPKGQIPEGVE